MILSRRKIAYPFNVHDILSGKIRAREIRIDALDMPDYVFEEDYKVGTLKELESYIKKNKHLPEVPSAKELERDGMAVGEMNKLLLKKIEELTLHLIDHEKMIHQQQMDIDELKKNAVAKGIKIKN